MTQRDFRKLLIALFRWAKAAKDFLEYQGNGKLPPRLDDARAEIPKAHPIRLSRSPGPYLAKLAMRWKPDQSTSDFLFESSDDPLYRLSCMAQEVLEVSESQWPGGGSEASRDLLALLRPIEEGGGRSATIADLKRIAELVESILGEKPFVAKEPIEDPAKALVASVAPVELLPSPPWRNGIAHAVKECLLAYLDEKIEDFSPVKTYKKRPEKLAELVRFEIIFAMNPKKKNPFVPMKGRWPVGRTAGGIMLITFDGPEIPTKRGRKPRET